MKKITAIFNQRKLKYGALSTVMTAAFIAVVIFVNIAASVVLSQVDMTVDISANRMFSIEASTSAFLAALDDDVTLTVTMRESDFVANGVFYNQINEILRRFSGASERVTVEYVDWLSNPDFAAKFEGEDLQGAIIVESANTQRRRILSLHHYLLITYYDLRTGNEITATEYQIMRQMGGDIFVDSDVSARAESAFLSAIISVTNTTPVRIGFATGYNEGRNPHMESLLAFNAYEFEIVDMMGISEIDPELDLFMIYAPTVDYHIDHVRMIARWLNNNGMFGKTLLYFAHSHASTPTLDEYFRAEWGVAAERAHVVQTDARFIAPVTLAGMPTSVQHFQPRTFNDTLNPSFRVFGDMMRHVSRDLEERGGVHSVIRTTPIISSNQGAVLVPFDVNRDEFDIAAAPKNEFDIGVMSTIEKFEGEGSFNLLESHVLVFGGTNVFISELLIRANANNEAFLLSMLGELSGKDSDVPNLSPRSFSVAMFELSREQANILGFVFAILLPIVLFIVGVGIWIRRIRS